MTPLSFGGSDALQQFLNQFPSLSQLLLSSSAVYFLNDSVTLLEINEPTRLYEIDSSVEYLYLLLDGSVTEQRTTGRVPNTETSLLRSVTSNYDEGRFNRTILGIYDLLYYDAKHSTAADVLVGSHARLLRINAAAIARLIYTIPAAAQTLAPLAIIEHLRVIPLFYALDTNHKLDKVKLGFIADCCEMVQLPARQELYAANDVAEWIYCIRKGQVQLSWDDDREPLLLGNGASFGFVEMNWSGGPYPFLTHSAQAISPLAGYRIPRRDFVRILGSRRFVDQHGLQLLENVQAALASPMLDPLFQGLLPEDRQNLSGYVSHYCMPHNYLVLQRGELNDSLWILMPDSLAQIHLLDRERAALPPIGFSGIVYFGETALHQRWQDFAGLEAQPGSQWLRIHRLDLELMEKWKGRAIRDRLQRSPLLTDLMARSRILQRSGLQQGEGVEFSCRRHWIILLWKLWPSLTIFAILLIFSLVVAGGGIAPAAWQNWFVLIGGSVIVPHFAWGLIDYFNDYLSVTNRHVIVQEEVLFFKHRRLEASLEQIQNIGVSTGLIGTILNFGTITISTAGTEGIITFTFAPDAHTLRKVIFAARERRNEQVRAESQSMIQQMLNKRLKLMLDLPERVLPDHHTPPVTLGWIEQVLQQLKVLFAGHTSPNDDRVIWRKHPIILLVKLLFPVTMLSAILLILVGQRLAWTTTLRETFLFLDILLALIGVALSVWITWLIADWRNDTYEVTDTTITDVEKKPLGFSDNSRSADLDKIQNITTDIPSFFHYVLNFGNVHLQTAATQGDFTFDWVPDPKGVAAEIQHRKDQYIERRRQAEIRQHSQELPNWFDAYDLMGGAGKRPERPTAT